jgi:hypothetical protein
MNQNTPFLPPLKAALWLLALFVIQSTNICYGLSTGLQIGFSVPPSETLSCFLYCHTLGTLISLIQELSDYLAQSLHIALVDHVMVSFA